MRLIKLINIDEENLMIMIHDNNIQREGFSLYVYIYMPRVADKSAFGNLTRGVK